MRNRIRRTHKPLKVEITHEEILADLQYPVRESKVMKRHRDRTRRR